jgi:acyl-CoA synthetase (AMP-forming)/AMP-acid ligase II
MTTVMGIIRAGYTAFPISQRNSAAAVAHLLSATNVTHMLVGEEQSMQSLANAALEIMKTSLTKIPATSLMPHFEDIYIEEAEATFRLLPPTRPQLIEPAIIFHSSGECAVIVDVAFFGGTDAALGSTAFPKPIPWPHHRLLQLAVLPCTFLLCYCFSELIANLIMAVYGEGDFAGKLMSFHAVPLSHGVGILASTWAVRVSVALLVMESLPAT